MKALCGFITLVLWCYGVVSGSFWMGVACFFLPPLGIGMAVLRLVERFV